MHTFSFLIYPNFHRCLSLYIYIKPCRDFDCIHSSFQIAGISHVTHFSLLPVTGEPCFVEKHLKITITPGKLQIIKLHQDNQRILHTFDHADSSPDILCSTLVKHKTDARPGNFTWEVKEIYPGASKNQVLSNRDCCPAQGNVNRAKCLFLISTSLTVSCIEINYQPFKRAAISKIGSFQKSIGSFQNKR